MDADSLFALGPPHLHLMPLPVSEAWDFALQLARMSGAQPVVRIVRGAKSRTLNDLFDEISAALQFPYYFGDNWAALDECLADLDWLRGGAYVLLFTESNRLLDGERSAELKILLDVLEKVAREWLKPEGRRIGCGPRPFHIAFQCSQEFAEAFVARVASLGHALKRLE